MKLPNYVPGSGPTSSPLMVIGEAPGKDEDEQLETMVGAAGREIDSIFRELGSSLPEHYKTNVVKFRPPDNDLKKLSLVGHSIEEGIPQLWQEIEAINPNCILAIGNLSLQVLTGKSGISKYRGSILTSQNGMHKVVPTLHPAALLYSGDQKRLPYSARTYIQLDFKRALEESQSREINLPTRTLLSAKSSMDVWNFLELYKNETKVSIDIETPACIPICVGLAFNSYHALSIPLLNTYGIQIPDGQLIEIWKMLEEFFQKDGLKIIGQNFKFDHEKLLRPCGFSVPNPWFDVMFAAHVLHPELQKDLGFLASIYTREPFWKDEGKQFNPKKDSVERLLLYNAKDAAVTYELYEKLFKEMEELNVLDYFFNYKMQLHELYMDIEREGFKVDYEQRRALWLKYDALEKEAADHLFDIAGHSFNYRSNPQVCNVLYNEMGFPPRKKRGAKGLSADADILAGLYANHAKTPQKEAFLSNLLNVRRYGKSKSVYLEAYPDYDGRHRGSHAICGTETGRTAVHKLEPPVRPDAVGLPMHNLTKHGDVGEDIRTILVVD